MHEMRYMHYILPIAPYHSLFKGRDHWAGARGTARHQASQGLRGAVHEDGLSAAKTLRVVAHEEFALDY